MRRAWLVFAAVTMLACVRREPPTTPTRFPGPTRSLPAERPADRTGVPDVAAPERTTAVRGRAVRVGVAVAVPRVELTGTGTWRLLDSGGESTLLRAGPTDLWTIEQEGRHLRAVRGDGLRTALRPSPFVIIPDGAQTVLRVGPRRYRGELTVHATDSGLVVVNRIGMEDYLRGVVPLEIGRRPEIEMAAMEAQAVAARTYAVVNIRETPDRLFDVAATVLSQVYGGADAESPLTDRAVEATEGLIVTYGGRPITAVYHSTCGGTTAAASEVWRSEDQPYLVPVSDLIPGSDRSYCSDSPRFQWTRTLDQQQLASTVDRYLRAYVQVPGGRVGQIRQVRVDGRTGSGRARGLIIETDRGQYAVRGNDVRFVMRNPSGEILNSTYYSVDTERSGGAVSRIVFRGVGYGHGIGMCQWGAIGRARAGQDFRSILRTYYPGTSIERMG